MFFSEGRPIFPPCDFAIGGLPPRWGWVECGDDRAAACAGAGTCKYHRFAFHGILLSRDLSPGRFASQLSEALSSFSEVLVLGGSKLHKVAPNEILPNHLDKEVQNPILRWIFQIRE